jgi:hypothetical protein
MEWPKIIAVECINNFLWTGTFGVDDLLQRYVVFSKCFTHMFWIQTSWKIFINMLRQNVPSKYSLFCFNSVLIYRLTSAKCFTNLVEQNVSIVHSNRMPEIVFWTSVSIKHFIIFNSRSSMFHKNWHWQDLFCLSISQFSFDKISSVYFNKCLHEMFFSLANIIYRHNFSSTCFIGMFQNSVPLDRFDETPRFVSTRCFRLLINLLQKSFSDLPQQNGSRKCFRT